MLWYNYSELFINMANNAQLISKSGTIINFQVPPKVEISGSANFVEFQIHRGKTVQRWTGTKSITVSLRDAIWAGNTDLKNVLNQIKSSLGENSWTYSQGDRTIPNLAISSFNISEEFCIGGHPVRAKVSLELLEISSPIAISLKATVTNTVSAKTIADTVKKVKADKKVTVSISTSGVMTLNGKEVGKVSKAGAITYSGSLKSASTPSSTPPTDSEDLPAEDEG